MGVPAFFRWLSVRYSKVVIDALSEDELEFLYDEFKKDDPNEIDLLEGDLDGEIQRKIKENNPEFDNLYLDMNGIIHPCTHPPDKPQPKTEVEMFNNIFEYVDKIMKIVKPQRLIYMAIDGVAPRAKMNQQRSRRFRAALDTEEREQREAEIRDKWTREGIKFSGQATLDESASKLNCVNVLLEFDQNVITPGTEFMWRLSEALKYYVMERLQTHKLWKGLKVIYSDAMTPGEGEHKILDFIRSQRTLPGYDANTRHCIYGADADLIMLGLSTHEPHFCILREAFVSNFDKKCILCSEQGHLQNECPKNQEAGNNSVKVRLSKSISFQFIKLNVLREYLQLEFKDLQLPFAYDFERIIDDFVFLCFFVGNDFLPHLPSLDIREGAIDALMTIYRYQLPALGDYLTKNGEINLSKVDLIFNDIAKIEEEVFKNKKASEERYKQNKMNPRGGMNRGRGGMQRPQHIKLDEVQVKSDEVVTEDKNTQQEDDKETIEQFEQKAVLELKEKTQLITEEELNKVAAARMREMVKKLISEKSQKQVENYQDRIQFGSDGWKMRYYNEKFHVSAEDFEEFTGKIKQSYLEGLQWVYSYYYKGCVSWYWFYPFHYAPFASDLINCDNIEIKFTLGNPASAYEQLLGVFPKQSAHAIPACYRHLLSNPSSEIIDFYPTYFRLDINGARFAWMGVNLLPFIDRERLVKAMSKCEHGLSDLEKQRNQLGDVYLFVEKVDKSSSAMMQALNQIDFTKAKRVELLPSYKRNDYLGGMIKVVQTNLINKKVEMPIGRFDLDQIEKNAVFQLIFNVPKYELHLSKLLDGLEHPKREVEDFEIYHVQRRFFNGENAVRLLERVLGIDTGMFGQSSVYTTRGYQNNQAIGYQGARSVRPQDSIDNYQQRLVGHKRTHDQAHGQSMERPHHRSRYDNYNQDQQRDRNYYQRNDGYNNNSGQQQMWRQPYQQPQNNSYYNNQQGYYQQQNNYRQDQHYNPNYQGYQQPRHQQYFGYQMAPQQQQQPQQEQTQPALMDLFAQLENAAASQRSNGNQQQSKQGHQQQSNNRFQGFMDQ